MGDTLVRGEWGDGFGKNTHLVGSPRIPGKRKAYMCEESGKVFGQSTHLVQHQSTLARSHTVGGMWPAFQQELIAC